MGVWIITTMVLRRKSVYGYMQITMNWMSEPMRKILVLSLVLIVALVMNPHRAEAITSWDNDAEPCLRSFVHPKKVKLERLVYCMRVWATFRTPSTIPAKERNLAIPAFQRVYVEGTGQEQYDSRLVLQSLGAPIPKLTRKARGASGKEGRRGSASRKKFEPMSCSRSENQSAERSYKNGNKSYKKKRYQNARESYETAVARCDAHVAATYKLAATCSILGMKDDALEYLQRLNDMGTGESIDKLHDARVDPNFASLREDSSFKLITGYVRVKVLNSIGEFGEEEVERIGKLLTRLRHPVAATGSDKYRRKRPFIWYNHLQSSRVQAMLFKDVVDHPDTRTKPINWDSEFDVIISWGVEIVKDQYGDSRPTPVARSADPDNLDKKMQSMEHKQNQALREPDQAANKANRVLGTPERAKNKAENAVKRTERTLNKIEGVGKKLGF